MKTDLSALATSRKLPTILPRPDHNVTGESQLGNHVWRHDLPRDLFAFHVNERDASYFDLFRVHIVRDLSGYAYSEFWSRTILRESMEDQCIRHCVLGIGALSRSLQFDLHPVNHDTILDTEAFELTQHREAALRHYGKALRLYRQRVAFGGDRPSTQRILPAALLCMVFEFLQGHISAVDGLITSSIKLLRDEIRTLQSPCLPGSETDEAEDLLARLAALSAITPFFPSSQRHYGILDARPLNVVPEVDCNTNTVTVMWKSSYTRLCIFGSRCQGAAMSESSFHPDKVKKEREAHLTNLREWRKFFDSRLGTEKNRNHRRSLVLMTIQCHIGSLFVQGCMDSEGGLTYDGFTEEYRKILALFKMFLEDPGEKPKIRFTFEIGILPSICMVIHTCRQRGLREEAADVLTTLVQYWGDFREGPWDSRILAKGFRTLMTLEEAGMDETGFIPPYARFRWTGTVHDLDNGHLVAEYTSLLPGENGERTKGRVDLHI